MPLVLSVFLFSLSSRRESSGRVLVHDTKTISTSRDRSANQKWKLSIRKLFRTSQREQWGSAMASENRRPLPNWTIFMGHLIIHFDLCEPNRLAERRKIVLPFWLVLFRPVAPTWTWWYAHRLARASAEIVGHLRHIDLLQPLWLWILFAFAAVLHYWVGNAEFFQTLYWRVHPPFVSALEMLFSKILIWALSTALRAPLFHTLMITTLSVHIWTLQIQMCCYIAIKHSITSNILLLSFDYLIDSPFG